MGFIRLALGTPIILLFSNIYHSNVGLSFVINFIVL